MHKPKHSDGAESWGYPGEREGKSPLRKIAFKEWIKHSVAENEFMSRKKSFPPKRVRSANINDLKLQYLFKDVDDEYLEEILPRCHICELGRNKRLESRSRGGKYLYIIRQGYVAIRCETTLLEWDEVFLGWRGPGDALGEIDILCKDIERTTVTIKATDPCELLELPPDLLDNTSSSISVYKNIAHLLGRKMVQDRKRSEVLSMTMGTRRIAQSLLVLVEQRGFSANTHKIRGTVRIVDIAGYVGGSKDAVSSALKTLREKGIIFHTDPLDGSVEILDVKRLHDEADHR